MEFWYRVQSYRATQLEPYDDPRAVLAPVPTGAEIRWGDMKFRPVVGREVLHPVSGAEVLARFGDGGAAAVRHRFGKGQAWVIGFFPGLEYSAAVRREDFDMARDFDPRLRGLVAGAALERTRPVVDAAQPPVEGLLVRNPASGARAVVLMNWAYRVSAKRVEGRRTSTVKSLVPFKDLRVTVRGAGEVRKVSSAALGRELAVERGGEVWSVAVPELQEGDVLLLE